MKTGEANFIMNRNNHMKRLCKPVLMVFQEKKFPVEIVGAKAVLGS